MCKIVHGDILSNINHKVPTAILHGCNCFHTMGSGIAKYLANKYPSILLADRETPYGDKAKLGTFSKATVGNVTIYNCYTQFRYGKNTQHVDYLAIGVALVSVKGDIASTFGDLASVDIRSPKIGCGLAGGSWDIVKILFETILPEATIYVK